jgi:hypothetical protein
MRKAEFHVPSDVIEDFAEALTDTELDNTITGVNRDGEIIIEVQFDKSEEDQVTELEALLEKLIQESEEQDEEDDQD